MDDCEESTWDSLLELSTAQHVENLVSFTLGVCATPVTHVFIVRAAWRKLHPILVATRPLKSGMR